MTLLKGVTMNKYHVLGALLGFIIGIAVVVCLMIYQEERPVQTVISDFIHC